MSDRREADLLITPESRWVIRLLRAVICGFLSQREAREPPNALVQRTSREKAEVLAQFHAAEYASERNSVDVWKTLQYALIPIIFVAWGLLLQVRQTLPSMLFWWALAAVLPLCYVAYQKAMVDALTGVLLIEERVRPRAIELAGTNEFWFHEPIYRKSVRPDAAYGWYWPPLLSFASPVAALACRIGIERAFITGGWLQHVGDTLGFLACCAVAWFVGRLSKEGLALNRRIGEQIRTHRLGWAQEA